jgi:DNA-directed RNA polymerase specialized sigma subunit
LEEYRAEDLKQIFSSLLWKDLQTYDSNITLLQQIKFKALSAWHEYVRLNCGNFQPDNRNQYTLLRKIARLYYLKSDGSKILTEISAELNLTEKSVEDYITAVAGFKPKYNAEFYADDEDKEYNASAIDTIADRYTTEDWFFRIAQKEKLISALTDLTITEQKLIESKFGICLNCLGNLPKSSMSIVSMSLGLTESGAEKKLKAILKKLRKAIQE